jgi:hypothetical protein
LLIKGFVVFRNYSSSDIFWAITSRMRWAGNVECMAGKRNIWSVLVNDRERMKEL